MAEQRLCESNGFIVLSHACKVRSLRRCKERYIRLNGGPNGSRAVT
jgi:hypothetical protein